MPHADQTSVPAVSVAMCTYNGARHLEQQLASIAAQSLLPSELVVCDDGSTDTTLQLLSEFARSAHFPVRIHRNAANLGYTKNFEQALNLCSGEFLALSDQDDIWHPAKLQTLSQILIDSPTTGGVFSDGDLIEPDGKIGARSLWQSVRFGPAQQSAFASRSSTDVLLRGNVVTGMTLMIRAGARSQLLPIPPPWVHDAWLAWMLCLKSRLIACPARLVAYRLHANQQMGVPLTRSQKLLWVARHGLGTYFTRARLKSLAEYRQTLDRLEDLRTQVAAHPSAHRAPLLNHLNRKLHHAEMALQALAQPRHRRMRHVLGNTQDYLRYSAVPFRSLFRDLVL